MNAPRLRKVRFAGHDARSPPTPRRSKLVLVARTVRSAGFTYLLGRFTLIVKVVNFFVAVVIWLSAPPQQHSQFVVSSEQYYKTSTLLQLEVSPVAIMRGDSREVECTQPLKI